MCKIPRLLLHVLYVRHHFAITKIRYNETLVKIKTHADMPISIEVKLTVVESLVARASLLAPVRPVAGTSLLAAASLVAGAALSRAVLTGTACRRSCTARWQVCRRGGN